MKIDKAVILGNKLTVLAILIMVMVTGIAASTVSETTNTKLLTDINSNLVRIARALEIMAGQPRR